MLDRTVYASCALKERKGLCTVDGCSRKLKAHGLCDIHLKTNYIGYTELSLYTDDCKI